MRTMTLILTAILLVTSSSTAGLPDPQRSGMGLSDPGVNPPCQYRFRADGGLDILTVYLTLRDVFDAPVPFCSTSVTLRSTPTTEDLCSCCPLKQTQTTNAMGEATFIFSKIGGRGDLAICMTAHCVPPPGYELLPPASITFTSPDLNGSCEEEPNGAATVVDLGIWAGSLHGLYEQWADYDCDQEIDVVDLSVWAGGLGVGCDGCP